MVKFTHNWNNKLENKIFTTIRRFVKSRRDYYEKRIGDVMPIILNDTKMGNAKLLTCITTYFNKIDGIILILDTGMSDVQKIKELFRKFGIKENDLCYILLFERINNG